MSVPISGISVVVPTYNRRDRLRRVLAALVEQQVDVPIEVVVISDGSTDGTNDDLTSAGVPSNVVPVIQENGGPSRARNAGVDRARHDLIVFVDDDVVLEPGGLAAHLDAHRRLGDRVVVIGPMLDPTDVELLPWVSWEQRQLAKQYDAMNAGRYAATCRQFYTGNASVRRDHLIAVGGFDPAFRRAEDVELAFRLDDAGLGFHFEPTAVGRHYAERSYEAWHRTARAYGRNDIVFSREHGRTWIEDMIVAGFHDRPLPARALVRAAVRVPAFARAIERLAGAAVRHAGHRADRLVQGALSMVYAIEFSAGAAEQLGSRRAFLELVSSSTPPSER